jgi:hypothetical protein
MDDEVFIVVAVSDINGDGSFREEILQSTGFDVASIEMK